MLPAMSRGLPAPSATEQAELLDWWTQRSAPGWEMPFSGLGLVLGAAAAVLTTLAGLGTQLDEPAGELLLAGLGPLFLARLLARQLRPVQAPWLSAPLAGFASMTGLALFGHVPHHFDSLPSVALGTVMGSYVATLVAALGREDHPAPAPLAAARAALARPDGPELVLLLFAADTPDGGRTLARFDLWPDRGWLTAEYTPYTPTYLGGSGPVWSARALKPDEAGQLHRLASVVLPPVPRPARHVRPCLVQVLRRDLPDREAAVDLGVLGQATEPVVALVQAAVDAARRTAREG